VRGRDRSQLFWVLGGTAVMVLVDLGRRILTSNDEARFPLLAQEILARSDWLFPTLNGAVYHNKPLLFAWLIALVSWPFGHVTQVTAVIPSAAAAFATALVIFGAGRDMFGADAGKYAALVAITTQGVFLHGRLPMPDMLLTLFITASLWMLWRMQRGAPWAWVGFYAFVGLAFWSKGPGGFLPLALALVWAIVDRSPGRWRALRLPAGVMLLALIVAPWPLIGLALHSPGLRHAVVQNQLLWYLPQTFRPAVVAEPIQNAFGILFPWVLVAPLVFVEAWRRLREPGKERDAVFLLLVSSATMFVVVALSHQQRFRYYLPLVSPVALMIGWWVASVVEHQPVPRIPWRVYGVAGGLLVATAVLAAIFRRNALREISTDWPAYAAQAAVLVAMLTAVGVALVAGPTTGRLRRAVTAALAGSAVLVASGYHWEIERRNAAYDYPRLQERMQPILRETPVVATLGLADMPLAFYLRRRVVPAVTHADLREVVRGATPAVAIVSDRALASMGSDDAFTVLLRDNIASRPIAVVGYRPAPPQRQ